MYIKLGKRIRRLRESMHMTQEQVADKLDISRQKLARIENGQNDISYAFLDGFSNIIGKPVSDITCILENSYSSTATVFRSTNGNSEDDSFGLINSMLDLFYANKHLYNRVRNYDE